MDKEAAGALDALRAQHRDLSGILESLPPHGWQRPTRCDGWTVADVVLHLAQTDEMAMASLEGRVEGFLRDRVSDGSATTVDAGAAAMVERERATGPEAIRQRWATAASKLDEMLAGRDPHDRVVWVAGELSVRTLATTRLAEAWIHTGDVAGAVGAPVVMDDRLRHIARLAWRTLPYAFARDGRRLAGPVAFFLQSPSGDEWAFEPDGEPATTVRGAAVDLCLVAARRAEPAATSLVAGGPDGDAVLELVRTYA